MGKQTMPRAIDALSDQLAVRGDAEALYAEFPKRALFDALWEAAERIYNARPGTTDASATLANVRTMAKRHR